jgi:hypothetical protein
MRDFHNFIADKIQFDEGLGNFFQGMFGKPANPRASGAVFQELLDKVGDEEKANQIYDQAVKISSGREDLVKHYLRRFITFGEPVPQKVNYLTDPRSAGSMHGATVATDTSRADLRTFRGRDQGGVAGVGDLQKPKMDTGMSPGVAPRPTPPKQNPWKTIRR